jgi:hypothetical protein
MESLNGTHLVHYYSRFNQKLLDSENHCQIQNLTVVGNELHRIKVIIVLNQLSDSTLDNIA